MIEIDHLTKCFGRLCVLDELCLSVPAGERVALVGANGAGKTTLIRTLLGEYRFEGKVRVAGQPLRSERCAVLRQVAFVPQLPPALRMPVGQLMRFAAEVCGSHVARMEAVSQRLGLDPLPLARRAFSKLSGGQKQKLLISIALGRESRVLILDEPAANLDPDARAAFFDLLAERQDATMLISSHRLDEVAALVHRVVELDHGRVALDDRVADASGLRAMLDCQIELQRSDASVARTLQEWGFEQGASSLVWGGQVASPDRLRFLGVLSRYSGLLASLRLEEEEKP